MKAGGIFNPINTMFILKQSGFPRIKSCVMGATTTSGTAVFQSAVIRRSGLPSRRADPVQQRGSRYSPAVVEQTSGQYEWFRRSQIWFEFWVQEFRRSARVVHGRNKSWSDFLQYSLFPLNTQRSRMKEIDNFKYKQTRSNRADLTLDTVRLTSNRISKRLNT
jgi:hypothetical protein